MHLRRVLVSGGLLTLVGLGWTIGCSSDPRSGADGGGGRTGRDAGLKHGLTSQQAAKVLAKVGNSPITLGEFADRLSDQSPYLRARYNSPERRREFLENLIRFELLAAEASRRGFDRLPEVDRTRKQVMIQRLMKREFEDRVKLSDITDADMRRYYEQHRAEYHKPEQVRAAHILFDDRAAGERVLAEITKSPADLKLFRSRTISETRDAETRDRGGDLRFFSRPGERQPDEPEIPSEVAEAAFGLSKIGEVAPRLVKSPRGWHIVKLTGKRAKLDRSFEEVRRQIQNRLWRERRQQSIDDFIARLRREANVQVDEPLLGTLRVDVPDGGMPPSEGHGGSSDPGGDPGSDDGHGGHSPGGDAPPPYPRGSPAPRPPAEGDSTRPRGGGGEPPRPPTPRTPPRRPTTP